jgi:hypothetical protein
MTQRTRIALAIVVVVAMVTLVLGVEWIRRQTGSSPGALGQPTLVPGSIPVYVDGQLAGGFQPADLERLERAHFIDAEEGKVQEGWLLRDVLLLYVDEEKLKPHSCIVVSSSSRGKAAQVTWAEADDAQNMVMFDLSNRGTLKLLSVLDKLSTRDQWIQDADKIELETRPQDGESP